MEQFFWFIAALLLMLIASWANLISKKFKIPYTIFLFIIWLFLSYIINRVPLFKHFYLTPDLLFFVFLPILVYESAYNIKYDQLVKNRLVIRTLATVWVLISSFTIWFIVYYWLNLIWIHIPFIASFLFGVIISATDPVAVLALFKNLWVSKRLNLIFEWESLFNDWTSLALFLIVLEIINKWVFNVESIGLWIREFLIMIFWWMVLWSIMWALFAKIIQKIKNNEPVELALTMVMAHLTFILAEYINYLSDLHWRSIKISWIIATAYVWIVMWNYGRTKISPKVEEVMDKFRNFFSFLANSLIFILMWLAFRNINFHINWIRRILIISILAVNIWRIVSVYIPIKFLNSLKSFKRKIPESWIKLLARWDLRWAMALIMVFIIPDDFHINWRTLSFSPKHFIMFVVFSYIIFSLIIKWLTIEKVIKKMKLDSLHSLEIFEKLETEILIYTKIIEKIKKMMKDFHTFKDNYVLLLQKYEIKLSNSIDNMKAFLKKQKNPEELVYKALSLHALWIEKEYLKQMFKYNEIDEIFYLYWKTKLDRQTFRLEEWEEQIKLMSKKFFKLLNIFFKAYKKPTKPEEKYIVYRTKFIISSQVLKNLEELKQIDFWYPKNIFDKVESLYKNFHQEAEEEINKLKAQYPWKVLSMNYKLLEKALVKIEEKLLKELFEKEIITKKLYNFFVDEFESQIQQDFMKD